MALDMLVPGAIGWTTSAPRLESRQEMPAERLQSLERTLKKHQREVQTLTDELAMVRIGLVKAAAVQGQEGILTYLEQKLTSLERWHNKLREILNWWVSRKSGYWRPWNS